jgi:hypothetical protein
VRILLVINNVVERRGVRNMRRSINVESRRGSVMPKPGPASALMSFPTTDDIQACRIRTCAMNLAQRRLADCRQRSMPSAYQGVLSLLPWFLGSFASARPRPLVGECSSSCPWMKRLPNQAGRWTMTAASFLCKLLAWMSRDVSTMTFPGLRVSCEWFEPAIWDARWRQ